MEVLTPFPEVLAVAAGDDDRTVDALDESDDLLERVGEVVLVGLPELRREMSPLRMRS